MELSKPERLEVDHCHQHPYKALALVKMAIAHGVPFVYYNYHVWRHECHNVLFRAVFATQQR